MEKAQTLNAEQTVAVFDARGNGDGKTVPTITGDHVMRNVMPFDTTQITSKENGSQPRFGWPCHPITAQGHTPSVVIRDYTEENQARCIGNGQTQNITMDTVANAIDTMHDRQAVLVTDVDCRNMTENQTTNGTLQAKSNGGISYNLQNVCRIGEYVRRITPLEEERLQGYPDGWTDIGEWIDSKGRTHKPADTPRYKALGNSIALPFWKWLLKRISAQYERDATLGSLFDGIGGFPYCWEQINGKGSARWASEIEEFPMAVTKRRFGE